MYLFIKKNICNKSRLWLGLFICLNIIFNANAQPLLLTQSFLSHQQTVIEKWLSDAGLASKIEVQKLRLNTHPDTKSGDRQAYWLELRFQTNANESEKVAQTAFQNFLDAQEAASGRQFPKQIFYTLVHLLGIGREYVSVNFHVSQSEFMVYFDSTAQEVVMREVTKRGIRHTLVVNPSLKSSVLKVRQGQAKKDIRQDIKAFFDDSYNATGKGTVKWLALDPNYIEAMVSGMRGQILNPHKYWEKLSLSVDVKPDASGWQLNCEFTGEYASGLGSNPPDDDAYYLMDKDFSKQFDNYTKQVLTSLQQRLEKDE